MTSRNYCFTDNTCTFTPTDVVKYAIWQKEKTTHEHFQGYLELKKPTRLAGMKKIWPNIHFELRKGTQQQAIDYCKKSETKLDGPWEFGIPGPGAGARTDIISLKTYAMSGKRKREMPDELVSTFAKYTKFYLIYEGLSQSPIRLDLKVLLIIGKTGTGKTRKAWDLFPELYSLPISTKKDLWFDGYDGQDCVLFDDFAGQIRLNELLRLIDIYPIRVPIKGGFTDFKPTKIIITTNIHPNNWYKYVGREEHYNALKRRIHGVINMDESEELVDNDKFFL